MRASKPSVRAFAACAGLLTGCALGSVSGVFGGDGNGQGDGGHPHGDGSAVPEGSGADGLPGPDAVVGDDSGQPQPDGATPTYTVGGVVSGLSAGDTLSLQLSGGSNVSITTNGPFTFPAQLASGTNWQVTATNPTSPIPETCQVAGGAGTIANANVTSVQVTCACTPTTCGAQGKNCGSIPDGCGGSLPCGSCSIVPQTCGGGGTANVCGACGVAVENTTIGSGQSLVSCDNRFTLAMQASDGNLVLYMGNTALWSSNTAGNPGAYAVMQGDGNFVVYTVSNSPLWSSNTAGNPGAYVIAQTDGNLVVYDVNQKPLWSSNTCCH